MSNFFLFLFHEVVEIVKCVSEGGEVKEMGNKFVVSTKKFEDLVTVGAIFYIVPKFIGSKSNRLLGHRQSVWSGSKSRGGLEDESCPHSALKSSQASINSQISSHIQSNHHSSSSRK
jgi:hypothetical protein